MKRDPEKYRALVDAVRAAVELDKAALGEWKQANNNLIAARRELYDYTSMTQDDPGTKPEQNQNIA